VAALTSHHALADLRHSCPVSSPRPGVHLAVRHADVAAALADAEHFSVMPLQRSVGIVEAKQLTPQDLEGATHRRLRQIWLAGVGRADLGAAERHARAVCSTLVAHLTQTSRVDLVAQLAAPAVAEIFDHLIGIPPADRADVRRWVQAIRHDEAATPPALRGISSLAARDALAAWTGTQVKARRTLPQPRDDLVSRLLQASDESAQPLTETEFAAQIGFLCRAGTGATTRLIGNLLFELISVPAHYRAVREDRNLLGAAIAESLRHDPPGSFIERRCLKSLELHGVAVRPGDQLSLSVASANRDELVFGAAENFDLDRTRRSHHLAFGRGRHRCPGAGLARVIVESVLTALLDAVADPRLAPGFVYEPLSFSAWGPRRLDVQLGVERSSGSR
jgi:cytochrome P450